MQGRRMAPCFSVCQMQQARRVIPPPPLRRHPTNRHLIKPASVLLSQPFERIANAAPALQDQDGFRRLPEPQKVRYFRERSAFEPAKH